MAGRRMMIAHTILFDSNFSNMEVWNQTQHVLLVPICGIPRTVSNPGLTFQWAPGCVFFFFSKPCWGFMLELPMSHHMAYHIPKAGLYGCRSDCECCMCTADRKKKKTKTSERNHFVGANSIILRERPQLY